MTETVLTPVLSGVTFSAVDPGLLERVRVSLTDVSGNPVVTLTAAGDEPLRCCLRDARAAEGLILFGYEPILPPSPYREVGAIFAHDQNCGGPELSSGYPMDWIGRPQVLRSYDRRGWIVGAKVHDGHQPLAVIEEMLGDPDVVQLHSRNVAYGCFMFAAYRRSATLRTPCTA